MTLLIIEMLSGTLVLMCFSFGAMAAAGVALFAGFQWQLGSFVVVTCLSLLVVKRFWSHNNVGHKCGRPSNVDALIGKTGRVDEDIHPDRTGWVSIDGDVWKAALMDGVTGCKKDSRVVIRKMEGLIVFVEPAGDS